MGKKTINALYVRYGQSGVINLYGARYDRDKGTVVVLGSTQNSKDLAKTVFGSEYTNEDIEKHLRRCSRFARHKIQFNLVAPIAGPTPVCLKIASKNIRFAE